jgi:hypothetical protein
MCVSRGLGLRPAHDEVRGAVRAGASGRARWGAGRREASRVRPFARMCRRRSNASFGPAPAMPAARDQAAPPTPPLPSPRNAGGGIRPAETYPAPDIATNNREGTSAEAPQTGDGARPPRRATPTQPKRRAVAPRRSEPCGPDAAGRGDPVPHDGYGPLPVVPWVKARPDPVLEAARRARRRRKLPKDLGPGTFVS